jgi:hypothetical protein
MKWDFLVMEYLPGITLRDMLVYRIGTAGLKAEAGKGLVVFEFRFDTSKIPNEQEVFLRDLYVLGPAGVEDVAIGYPHRRQDQASR